MKQFRDLSQEDQDVAEDIIGRTVFTLVILASLENGILLSFIYKNLLFLAGSLLVSLVLSPMVFLIVRGCIK